MAIEDHFPCNRHREILHVEIRNICSGTPEGHKAHIEDYTARKETGLLKPVIGVISPENIGKIPKNRFLGSLSIQFSLALAVLEFAAAPECP